MYISSRTHLGIKDCQAAVASHACDDVVVVCAAWWVVMRRKLCGWCREITVKEAKDFLRMLLQDGGGLRHFQPRNCPFSQTVSEVQGTLALKGVFQDCMKGCTQEALPLRLTLKTMSCLKSHTSCCFCMRFPYLHLGK